MQQAKTLLAQAIEQLELHLIIGQVVQPLEYYDAYHHLEGVCKTRPPLRPSLCSTNPSANVASWHKINVLGDDLQGVSNFIELVLAAAARKKVELQRTAWGDPALNLLHSASAIRL